MMQPIVIKTDAANFLIYDLEGPDQQRLIRWLPVTYDRATAVGSYYFKMLPGAVTTPHTHQGYEEFFIIEGEAIESDGRILKAGDFVSFAPGSHHHTRTETGCLMLVVEWRAPGRGLRHLSQDHGGG
jgi:quercetin dioxygenase-like cupin family protein